MLRPLSPSVKIFTVWPEGTEDMDAPKCRLCGNRHYGLCPTTVEREIESTPKQTSKQPESLIAPEKPAKKPQFDRNAYHKQYMKEYMRNYMREYRQKQKLTQKT
jgi:hypothetical protein